MRQLTPKLLTFLQVKLLLLGGSHLRLECWYTIPASLQFSPTYLNVGLETDICHRYSRCRFTVGGISNTSFSNLVTTPLRNETLPYGYPGAGFEEPQWWFGLHDQQRPDRFLQGEIQFKLDDAVENQSASPEFLLTQFELVWTLRQLKHWSSCYFCYRIWWGQIRFLFSQSTEIYLREALRFYPPASATGGRAWPRLTLDLRTCCLSSDMGLLVEKRNQLVSLHETVVNTTDDGITRLRYWVEWARFLSWYTNF